MFKKRAIQISVVDADTKANTSAAPCARPHFDTEAMNQIAKDQVKHVATAIVVVAAAVTALSTAKQIAINIAPKR